MSGTEQMSLALSAEDREPTLEEAHARGWLRIEVEERQLYRDGMAYHDALRHLPNDERIRVVHVISVFRKMEIRGYVIARGELYTRMPVHFEWPEMDAWVAAQLDVSIARGAAC